MQEGSQQSYLTPVEGSNPNFKEPDFKTSDTDLEQFPTDNIEAILKAALPIFQILKDYNIRFTLIGSITMALAGMQVEKIGDMDILIPVDQIDKANNVLAEYLYREIRADEETNPSDTHPHFRSTAYGKLKIVSEGQTFKLGDVVAHITIKPQVTSEANPSTEKRPQGQPLTVAELLQREEKIQALSTVSDPNNPGQYDKKDLPIGVYTLGSGPDAIEIPYFHPFHLVAKYLITRTYPERVEAIRTRYPDFPKNLPKYTPESPENNLT